MEEDRMLVFSNQSNTEFIDHLDSKIRYCLPNQLKLTQTSTGEPDFFLLRYKDQPDLGGVLKFRLQFSYPNQNTPVSFEAGEFRLRIRSPIDDETGQAETWHPIVSSDRTLTSSTHLSPSEVQILRFLLENSDNVVEVETRLHYRGLVLGIPWFVTAQTQALRTHLAALLGESPVDINQIIVAFLSLPAQIVTWRSIEPDAIEPEREIILTELAWRSLANLFQQDPITKKYQLLPSIHAVELSWDLIPPRQEIHTHILSWSISAFLEQITDPQQRKKLFPIIDQVEFFGTLPIHIINFLPIDPRYLREVRVSLRFLGSNGVPEYHDLVFDGQKSVEQMTAIFPALMPFQIDYRLSAILAPPNGVGWLRTIKRDYIKATEPTIEINQKAAGIDFFRIEVEPATFEKASAIEISVAASTLILTKEQSSAWIALPNSSPENAIPIQCIAKSSNTSYILIDKTTTERNLRIAAYQLEIFDPDEITLTLDPESDSQFHYVAISLAQTSSTSTQRRELTSSQPLVWKLFGRRSVFDPVRFRYQIHYVAYDDDRNTLPIASTEWVIAEGNALTIRPPLLTKLLSQVSQND
jgi:hypothetical protein